MTERFNTGEYTPGQERVPQTAAERLTAAADRVAGLLRNHLVTPPSLSRGESYVTAQEFKPALDTLMNAWYEYDPRVGNIFRAAIRGILEE